MQSFYGTRDPRSVREARGLVVDAVEAGGCGELAWTASLLTSELATNALIHGDTPFGVRVLRTEAGVRVEVDDDGGGTPVELGVDNTADRGRGLMMVARMARRWGVERHGNYGKTVWFEL